MGLQKNEKTKICSFLKTDFERKAEDATRTIRSAKESRDTDTKSSAGDKHETGRAMMQMEMEKNEVQLSNIRNLQNEILRIDLEKTCTKVEFGSLVMTNEGKYFISIGLGKFEVEKEIYYLISLASPIGSIMKDKLAGERIEFQGREIFIKEII